MNRKAENILIVLSKIELPDIQIESNMKADDLDFCLDNESAVLFQILRDKIYSDPITATVRELCSNALDANQEVGLGNKPIEIWMPGSEFIVKDYGPGISPWRMDNIYRKYGKSTKGDDNNQIGAFGLGAKCFMAYTSSATIETNVDGIKYLYLAYLNETNKGGIKLISESTTDEPNGTTIKVPVKEEDKHRFKQAILGITKYFDPQPNFIGEYKHTPIKPTIEAPKWAIYSGGTDGYNVLYAGLPYKDIRCNIPSGVVLKFAIGSISLTASRENLAYGGKTEKAIAEAILAFRQECKARFAAQIDNCDNFGDVCSIIHKIPTFSAYSNEDQIYTWKKHVFQYPIINRSVKEYSIGYGNRLESHDVRKLDKHLDENYCIKLDKDIIAPYDKSRIRSFMKERQINEAYLLYPEHQLPFVGTPLSTIKVKRTTPAVGGPKLPKPPKTQVKAKRPYGGARVDLPINTTETIVYTTDVDKLVADVPSIYSLGIKFYCLEEKEAKHIENAPNWVEFSEHLQKEFFDKISEPERQIMANKIYGSENYNKLAFLAKDFPEFTIVLRTHNISEANIRFIKWLINQDKIKPEVENFLEKYPMLKYCGYITDEAQKDVIKYIKLINSVKKAK